MTRKQIQLNEREAMFLGINTHLTPVKRLNPELLVIRDTLKDEWGDYIHYVLVDGWKVQSFNTYFTLWAGLRTSNDSKFVAG